MSPAGLEPPPFVHDAPTPLFLAPQTADVRARATKMWGRTRTRPEGVPFDPRVCHACMHSQRLTLSAEEGFGDRQS
jgi:hypothetical protein